MSSALFGAIGSWCKQFTAGPGPSGAVVLVAAFAAHNIEEIYSFELLASSSSWPSPVSQSTFALATIILTTVAGLLAYGGVQGKYPWTGLFFLAAWMIGLNAIGHMGRALAIQAYVPGVTTSALLVAPACFVVIRRMAAANELSLGTVGVSVAIGAAATIPVIIASLIIAAAALFLIELVAL